MAFSSVRPDSEIWLARAGATDAAIADAPVAVAALRADYERWSRWALGVVALALAVTGAVLTPIMIGAVQEWPGPLGLVDGIVLVGSPAAAALGAFLLVRLWRTGRRLTSAAGWWTALPYRSGAARPSAIGWWQARAVNLEPRILVRLVTGACAFLLALFGFSPALRMLIEGMPEGQLAFTGDPVWRRIAGGGDGRRSAVRRRLRPRHSRARAGSPTKEDR